MTEHDWLTSTDPARMLKWRQGSNPLLPECPLPPISERKLRLFACACCRTMIGLSNVDHEVLSSAEQIVYEGGRLTSEIADEANSVGVYWALHISAAEAAIRWASYSGTSAASASERADLLRCIAGNPFRPGYRWTDLSHSHSSNLSGSGKAGPTYQYLPRVWLTPLVRDLAESAYRTRVTEAVERTVAGHRCAGCGARHGQICRCVLGCHIDRGHLDPARLAVLADAVEESGCSEAAILEHLRSSGPHVRGCWVIDVLTGRE